MSVRRHLWLPFVPRSILERAFARSSYSDDSWRFHANYKTAGWCVWRVWVQIGRTASEDLVRLLLLQVVVEAHLAVLVVRSAPLVLVVSPAILFLLEKTKVVFHLHLEFF